jgi:hypothetical protein
MRDYKFRGMTKDGVFVYGSLVVTTSWVKHKPKQHTKYWIVTDSFGNGGWFNIRRRFHVLDGTVGQFTEIKDQNGQDIYEGDNDQFGNVVEYLNGVFCLNGDRPLSMFNFTVAGNVHQTLNF